jgi:hypothetical protein
MHNEFDNYHDLPRNITPPLKFLNFKIGYNKCMFMLFVTCVAVKVASCVFLKLQVKKF